mgnify:CR=1 FL=1|tara:strand:+ start:81 stop:434 length:354 start_codon:yes stop_codon:yes gene_type:complete
MENRYVMISLNEDTPIYKELRRKLPPERKDEAKEISASIVGWIPSVGDVFCLCGSIIDAMDINDIINKKTKGVYLVIEEVVWFPWVITKMKKSNCYARLRCSQKNNADLEKWMFRKG